jgi:hypothetical protein
MNTEERLFALMSLAEEYHETLEHEKNELKKIHNIHFEHANKTLEKFTSSNQLITNKIYKASRLSWLPILLTGLICISFILMTGFGIEYYIESRKNTIQEMNKTVQMLKTKGGEAEIGICGGKPCVRVMVTLDRYGDSKDFLIIDPK